VRARGETSDERSHKVALSLQSNLMTILCVGEHARDNGGKYLSELEDDIKQSLSLGTKESL
jgi:triosephosphate isomerase